MASIKGYVWYSPAEFEEKGYEIPETLDDLTALSDDDRGRGRPQAVVRRPRVR